MRLLTILGAIGLFAWLLAGLRYIRALSDQDHKMPDRWVQDQRRPR